MHLVRLVFPYLGRFIAYYGKHARTLQETFGGVCLYPVTALVETKVQERTKSLLELQEQQRQLFYTISHALQTPVTVLKSAIELYMEDSTAPEAHYMTQSVEELSVLISDLLELARLDAVHEDEIREVVDISRLIEEVTEYVEVICQEKSILLEKEVPNGLTCIGDERQLKDMLTNLLSNAVRYTAECPTRHIFVGLRKSGAQLQLEVTDTGIGISSEHLPHMFEHFYRAQNATDRIGYGLGLAIVKKIVERHNGSISVQSTPNTGTTFIITLPSASIS